MGIKGKFTAGKAVKEKFIIRRERDTVGGRDKVIEWGKKRHRGTNGGQGC
jgi:hypothetical protein